MEGRPGSTVCLTIERQEAPDIIGHRNLKRLVRLECRLHSRNFHSRSSFLFFNSLSV